jgi:uncharacterized phage protein (TIGR01671 family)
MREIKFRAWDKINEKMLHGDDGNLLINCWGNVFIYDDKRELAKLYKAGLESRDDIAIMMYAGVRDKKYKEIYEGDIIHIKSPDEVNLNYKEVVTFHDGCFYPVCEYPENENLCEVIGNIYENKELI